MGWANNEKEIYVALWTITCLMGCPAMSKQYWTLWDTDFVDGLGYQRSRGTWLYEPSLCQGLNAHEAKLISGWLHLLLSEAPAIISPIGEIILILFTLPGCPYKMRKFRTHFVHKGRSDRPLCKNISYMRRRMHQACNTSNCGLHRVHLAHQHGLTCAHLILPFTSSNKGKNDDIVLRICHVK